MALQGAIEQLIPMLDGRLRACVWCQEQQGCNHPPIHPLKSSNSFALSVCIGLKKASSIYKWPLGTNCPELTLDP